MNGQQKFFLFLISYQTSLHLMNDSHIIVVIIFWSTSIFEKINISGLSFLLSLELSQLFIIYLPMIHIVLAAKRIVF